MIYAEKNNINKIKNIKDHKIKIVKKSAEINVKGTIFTLYTEDSTTESKDMKKMDAFGGDE